MLRIRSRGKMGPVVGFVVIGSWLGLASLGLAQEEGPGVRKSLDLHEARLREWEQRLREWEERLRAREEELHAWAERLEHAGAAATGPSPSEIRAHQEQAEEVHRRHQEQAEEVHRHHREQAERAQEHHHEQRERAMEQQRQHQERVRRHHEQGGGHPR